jgi:hypothetical protein
VGRSSSLKGLNVRLEMGVAPNPVPTRADIVSAIQRIRTLNSKEIINRSSCIALLGWHERIGQCHLPMVSGGGYIGKEARVRALWTWALALSCIIVPCRIEHTSESSIDIPHSILAKIGAAFLAESILIIDRAKYINFLCAYSPNFADLSVGDHFGEPCAKETFLPWVEMRGGLSNRCGKRKVDIVWQWEGKNLQSRRYPNGARVCVRYSSRSS